MTITLARYQDGVRMVHAELLAQPDGMTMTELYYKTKIARSSLQVILENNPLFYVDRWIVSKKSAPTRVWLINVTSNYENCPRPDNEE